MSNKVLIVDDNMVSRMMIKEIITSVHSDWECIQAASADKAMGACLDSQFDFITLALSTAGLQGLETARSILLSQNDVKIALIATSISEEVKKHATELGLEFLLKPISVDGVQNFIR